MRLNVLKLSHIVRPRTHEGAPPKALLAKIYCVVAFLA
jgi:hypothetical protein